MDGMNDALRLITVHGPSEVIFHTLLRTNRHVVVSGVTALMVSSDLHAPVRSENSRMFLMRSSLRSGHATWWHPSAASRAAVLEVKLELTAATSTCTCETMYNMCMSGRSDELFRPRAALLADATLQLRNNSGENNF